MPCPTNCSVFPVEGQEVVLAPEGYLGVQRRPMGTLGGKLYRPLPVRVRCETVLKGSWQPVAGIAVGASALTAIFLVSASFLYAKRRKQRATAAACADPPAGQQCFFRFRIFECLREADVFS